MLCEDSCVISTVIMMYRCERIAQCGDFFFFFTGNWLLFGISTAIITTHEIKGEESVTGDKDKMQVQNSKKKKKM